MKLILIVALIASVSGGLIGYGVKNTIAKAEIAELEKGYADERTKAATASAEKSEEYRKISEAYRRRLAQQEREFADPLVPRDDRIKRLAASNDILSKHWDAVAKYSGPTGDTTRPCGYVQDRLEAVGILARERDRMAVESEGYADDVGDELRYCRGYADSLKVK